jgi:hypothetical protein
VIGLGSGATLAAVARHPVAHIDLVEISPEVLDLADRHFQAVNRGVLQDRRVALHVEDGRNFVAFNSTRAYDVISSEPSNPWMTGVASLFTDEFFAQVRARLRPGGILAQWFQYYSMEMADLRALVGTLQRHFASVYAFAFYRGENYGDLVLVASDAPLDFTRAVAAFGGEGAAGEDFRALDRAVPTELLAGLVVSPEIIDRLVGGAPLNSDDLPRVELRAPRALFHEDTAYDNLRALLEGSDGARIPLSRPAEGYQSGHFDARAPAGFRLTFDGYRIHVDDRRDAAGFPVRRLHRQITFEDGGARRVEVLSAASLADAAGLERLAEVAAGAAGEPAGELDVNGHVASVFHLPAAGADVVAWSCPETVRSHALALFGGAGTLEVAEATRTIRCRHP